MTICPYAKLTSRSTPKTRPTPSAMSAYIAPCPGEGQNHPPGEGAPRPPGGGRRAQGAGGRWRGDRRGVAPRHDDLPVREVDEPQHAEDEADAERHERVHRALPRRVDERLAV